MCTAKLGNEVTRHLSPNVFFIGSFFSCLSLLNNVVPNPLSDCPKYIILKVAS